MRQDTGQQLDLFKEAPVWWEGLTGPRRLFVECYCTDRDCFLNAASSYKKAFGGKRKELSESSIQSNSSRLMGEPKIKKAISKLLRAQQNEKDLISEFEVLDLLKKLAFYDPADIIDKYGNLKIKENLEELGMNSFCITGIKTNKGGKEVKLFDRMKALEILSRYLDLVRPAESNIVINPIVKINSKDNEIIPDTQDTPCDETPVNTENEGVKK